MKIAAAALSDGLRYKLNYSIREAGGPKGIQRCTNKPLLPPGEVLEREVGVKWAVRWEGGRGMEGGKYSGSRWR